MYDLQMRNTVGGLTLKLLSRDIVPSVVPLKLLPKEKKEMTTHYVMCLGYCSTIFSRGGILKEVA